MKPMGEKKCQDRERNGVETVQKLKWADWEVPGHADWERLPVQTPVAKLFKEVATGFKLHVG